MTSHREKEHHIMERLFNRIHNMGMSLGEHAFEILEKNICENAIFLFLPNEYDIEKLFY